MAVTVPSEFWLTRAMRTNEEPNAEPPAGPGHTAYNLAGIAILVILVAVALAYVIDSASRSSQERPSALGDGSPILQTVGGQELAIPQSWFRYGEQMKPGFARQVDLSFNLDLEEGLPPVAVEVVLMPAARTRASSTLLDAVYLHQFAEGTEGGIPGLVGKPLQEAEGYAGETVWYDPLSPHPFVAKCADAAAPDRPSRCLRTIHLPSGLAAVLSFDASALTAWRRFDTELARWLDQIGAL